MLLSLLSIKRRRGSLITNAMVKKKEFILLFLFYFKYAHTQGNKTLSSSVRGTAPMQRNDSTVASHNSMKQSITWNSTSLSSSIASNALTKVPSRFTAFSFSPNAYSTSAIVDIDVTSSIKATSSHMSDSHYSSIKAVPLLATDNITQNDTSTVVKHLSQLPDTSIISSFNAETYITRAPVEERNTYHGNSTLHITLNNIKILSSVTSSFFEHSMNHSSLLTSTTAFSSHSLLPTTLNASTSFSVSSNILQGTYLHAKPTQSFASITFATTPNTSKSSNESIAVSDYRTDMQSSLQAEKSYSASIHMKVNMTTPKMQQTFIRSQITRITQPVKQSSILYSTSAASYQSIPVYRTHENLYTSTMINVTKSFSTGPSTTRQSSSTHETLGLSSISNGGLFGVQSTIKSQGKMPGIPLQTEHQSSVNVETSKNLLIGSKSLTYFQLLASSVSPTISIPDGDINVKKKKANSGGFPAWIAILSSAGAFMAILTIIAVTFKFVRWNKDHGDYSLWISNLELQPITSRNAEVLT